METTPLQLQIRPILRCLSSTSSQPPPNNRRRRLREYANSVMPISDLSLRRITGSPYQFRFNYPKTYCFSANLTSINGKAMADKKKDVQEPSTGTKEKAEKGSEKSHIPPPPPPEKPLPGDCCGSGCVRCVWDVYYEELDEYNKLYNAKT